MAGHDRGTVTLPASARWAWAGAAAGAAVALAALALVLPDRPAGGWELDVVRWAAGLSDVIGVPARVVMELGTRAAVVAVAAVVWWRTRRWRPSVAVLAAGLGASLLAGRLKDLLERPRPTGVRVRDAATGYGFPSGHASTAFAVAVVVTALVPARWRWLPWLLALVVAGARIHVGVHFPLDALGGALLGIATGAAVTAALGPTSRQTANG